MKSIGIVGASGAVGEEIIQVLFAKKIPIKHLRLFASEKSAGKIQNTPFGSIEIEVFSLESASSVDIIFLAVSGEFAKENAKKLSEKGVIVIDNSSAFRYESGIPLVVPSINGNTIGNNTLIANPNCTTAILAMPLHPIYKEFGLKKVIVSTYQATSGAGSEGMLELLEQSKKFLNGETLENKIFAHSIPFNIIPQIDVFLDNGYTKEEMKVAWETKKIFNDENIAISCTAVRIPTLRAHAESVTIETQKPITAEAVYEILQHANGVDLVDNPLEKKYPMPINATRKYNVEVGRIRNNNVFGEYGLDFFVCGDQLLRGAALNAVEIAEYIINA